MLIFNMVYLPYLILRASVNVVTFADGMNAVDSRIQYIRDLKENTSSLSDLTMVTESDKGVSLYSLAPSRKMLRMEDQLQGIRLIR